MAFRAAVYDGQYLATWSPLAKDDASYFIIFPLLGGGVVAFRAAVYDGQYLATWSPLAKDDASFPQHLKRKGDVLINNYQYLRIRIE